MPTARVDVKCTLTDWLPQADRCNSTLPPDDVPDSDLPSQVVERRALERYPTSSSVVGGPTTVLSLFDHTARNKFASELRGAHPRISAYLEQPFGKENLLQTFTSDAALRHVLLPLWKSGCLFNDGPSWASLRTAHYPARVLDSLLREYGSVPLTMT